MGNIKSEIGSYFWLDTAEDNYDKHIKNNHFNWFTNSEDGSFTFSGRTAIALTIKNVIVQRHIKHALVPSYCCASMIQPLIDFNIPFSFYEITFNGKEIEYNIDKSEEYDLLLIMKYFCANAKHYDEIISMAKNKDCIVIEDITHILFNPNEYNNEADYQVASIRKWIPIPAGGLLVKRKGKLLFKPNIDSDDCVKTMVEAMCEKYKYITGKIREKSNYLKKFGLFETSLKHLNSMLKIDSISQNLLETIDIDSVISIRKSNANILHKRLYALKDIVFLDTGYEASELVPLFVPVMLSMEKRDKLRSFLIKRDIYCPIHWPEVKGAKPGIRENELSLICDQRYNANDMNYIADLIIKVLA